MKPYYEHDNISIYHGDCLEVMNAVAPFSDVLLTDPPYNYGKPYDGYADAMDPFDYMLWCREWWTVARALCKRMFVFPGHGNLPVWFQAAPKPSAVGCWYKPGNGGKGPLGFEEWEPFLYWLGDKGLLGGSSVIRCPIGRQVGLDDHPCPKPLELFAKMIKKARATSVLDCFVGSGTTLEAAKHLGVKAVGIEQSERYCEMAAMRLSQENIPFTEFDGEGPIAAEKGRQG